MKETMKITREMVAARAGVCKQTVSCYFSGKRKVSPAAAERIERAIKELNYVPNMLARSLVMKETRTLAVICNDIANPNYSEIIGGIERAAQREGYTVAVYNAKNFSQRIVTDIISRRMDGVIVLTFKKTIGEENFRYLAENGVRLVITHSAGEHAERYMQLEPDFSTGIDCAVRRLAELGHQKVAMLSCFPPGITIDERNKFFLESCARHFGGRAELLTGETPMEASLRTGEILAHRFLESGSKATAVFTTNDLMAVGALRVFVRSGREIAVVGIDNTVFAEYVVPSLSSIGYDKEAYGRQLIRMFLEEKNGEAPRLETVPTFFIERESIFPLKDGEQTENAP